MICTDDYSVLWLTILTLLTLVSVAWSLKRELVEQIFKRGSSLAFWVLWSFTHGVWIPLDFIHKYLHFFVIVFDFCVLILSITNADSVVRYLGPANFFFSRPLISFQTCGHQWCTGLWADRQWYSTPCPKILEMSLYRLLYCNTDIVAHPFQNVKLVCSISIPDLLLSIALPKFVASLLCELMDNVFGPWVQKASISGHRQ